MNGLVFEERRPAARSAPNRADIACFVGFVGRRPGPVPPGVEQALAAQGWTAPPYARPIGDLLDVPVAVDAWETFDRLFAWDRRDLDGRGALGASYLGAAVRSFFVQGGRKCYVVRAGDPRPLSTPRSERLLQVRALLPGYPARFDPSPADRHSWHGLGHLFGLPDVSFVSLPDLPDLVGVEGSRVDALPSPPLPPEQFVECSDPVPGPPADRPARFFTAPRADEAGYAAWARALRLAADAIAWFQREVQLVAGVPIPEVDSDADRDLLRFLAGAGWLAGRRDRDLRSIASAFVQLAYPWVLTPGSADLPEQVEPPDGVLAGALARTALTRGAFRSAAGLHLADAYGVFPALSREQTEVRTGVDGGPPAGSGGLTLPERVSLLGPTPSGLRVLSDVTTAASETYRLAAVNRLIAVIVRAARRLGEESAFEPSGEQTWADTRGRLSELLRALFRAGALQGATTAEAFSVRCDRSTMSQADIDSGRLIAAVELQAAAPIERITVVLALDEAGQVSLVSPRPARGAAA